jgi:hypothetical protein
VVAEQRRGGRDGLLGVEGIGKAALLRRSRHELGDPLRPGGADHGRAKTAFLPDQARQKAGRQLVRLRCAVDQPADRLLDGFGVRGRRARLRASRCEHHEDHCARRGAAKHSPRRSGPDSRPVEHR